VKRLRHVVPFVVSLGVIILITPCLAMVAYADPSSIPSSFEVAVSYADTEYRGSNVGACTNCFPDPWCGSPGVQFIGSSTNYNGNSTDANNCAKGDWDGGAVLVTNAGTTSITLTGLTVVLPLPKSGNLGSPSCAEPPRPIAFDLWFGQQYYYGNRSAPAYDGGPITVPAGGQAIFTGTSADGAYICPSGNYPAGPTGGTYDFDTSDANFLGGCAPTTDTLSDPQITFSATGYADTTYVDAGHIIDTGAIDIGMCGPTTANPEWPNEDVGWRLASSTCGLSCPTNQFGGHTVTISGSMTTTIVTATSTDVSQATLYAVTAVAAVFIAATGFLALRRRRPAPGL
jgi:hypothetical protein